MEMDVTNCFLLTNEDIRDKQLEQKDADFHFQDHAEKLRRHEEKVGEKRASFAKSKATKRRRIGN